MKEKVTIYFAMIILAILMPYLITLIMTGVVGDGRTIVKEFNSDIYVIDEGEEIDLEDYIIGVLASQIPIDYELETIKAQAVIARTYVILEMNEKNSNQVEELDQTYITKQEMLEQWGEKNYNKNYKVLRQAVSETMGEVMTYEDELIEALYHMVSIGRTISAEEIFDKEVDYLVSVESPFDIESKDYMSIKEMDFSEVKQILSQTIEGFSIQEDKILEEMNIVEKTEAGYVKEVSIGENSISGEKFKELFELPSTNFYIEEYNQKFRIVCLGKGNGVGLSQYGANHLAQSGSQYDEILKYYYKGIEIEQGV